MAEHPSATNGVRVVTLRSLPSMVNLTLGGFESALEASNSKIVERYMGAVEKLEAETAKSGPNVMITVQDRDASILQSGIAEHGDAGPPLAAGGLEAKFGDGPTGGDILGWLKSLLDHVPQGEWHPIVRPPDDLVGSLADTGRIAAVGDWGTNLYGAPVSAASISKAGSYELLLHLGDIYYSGTDTETKDRFLGVWPTGAGKVSRALNGNHEMYSGGYAYFDDVLPTFGQKSSYFALQNANWLLVGLDTAHTDHAVDAEQVRWLNAVVAGAGARKLILFSHHQPYSRLDEQGPLLQAALAGLLQGKRIAAWYWGHEHDCIIYDRHPRFGLLGRCIGHGGIPSPRKAAVLSAPTERSLAGITWKRLSATNNAPACLALDGPNPLIKGEEQKFGPHGYLTLEFDGPELIERVHLPDSTEILKGRV
jgi:hypothetical protein